MKIKNNIQKRIEWVDICKALAIIFVFLGHWETPHLKVFAYSFHLKLFFLASGFFAYNCSKKYTFKSYFIKKFKSIVIPMILWMIIAFFITHLDSNFSLKDVIYTFSDIRRIEPNYWFFPIIFNMSILYYLLEKTIKNRYIILILSYILLILFGKTGFFPFSISDNIFFSYLFIGGILNYSFWYVLGVVSFKFINGFISNKSKNKCFNIVGCIFLFASIILFFTNINNIEFIEKHILTNTFLNNNYTILTSSINIISIIYISTFLINSTILKELGKNTMIHMGLEYITHVFLSITLWEMFNLKPINLSTTFSVIIFVIIQFIIHKPIVMFINKFFPILNGKEKKEA